MRECLCSSITCWYPIPVTAYTGWQGENLLGPDAGSTPARTQIDVLYRTLSYTDPLLAFSFSATLRANETRRNVDAYRRFDECYCVYQDAASCTRSPLFGSLLDFPASILLSRFVAFRRWLASRWNGMRDNQQTRIVFQRKIDRFARVLFDYAITHSAVLFLRYNTS